LANWLRAEPNASVDLSGCAHMHTSVLQALISAGPRIDAPPTDAFLRKWVLPVLECSPKPEAVPSPA
jgi:hypothetical protein